MKGNHQLKYWLNSKNIFLIFIYTIILMSDQFVFEEMGLMDWLKDASQFTDKHHYTHSQVSKQHFLEDLLEQQFDNRTTHQQKTAHHREKNKVNVKNYRDRKRTQFESMKRQIQHLQTENNALKNQKYCRWCNKSFSPNIMTTSKTTYTGQQEDHKKCIKDQKDMKMDLQFEKPQLFNKKYQAKKGRIWIALGILMLVLGLTMHGFDGDKTYTKIIEIERQQVSKWVQQFKEKGNDDYYQVKMRLKEQSSEISKSQESGIQIHYRSPSEKDPFLKQEEVSINKQLLFGIHAQLEDIGNYL